MHATIRRYRLVPGSVAEATRRVQAEFVPLITRIPGFVSYHVLDAGDDVVISISLYERRASAEEGNRQAAAWVKAHMTPFLAGPMHVTVGEVKVAATLQPATGATAARAGQG